MDRYDLAIIGAGPGGYVAAIRAAQLGLKVAIVEKDRPGGVCLNWGCIPSKAIITSAEVYETLKGAERYGVRVQGLSCDYPRVIRRSRDAADRLAKGVHSLLRKKGVTFVTGSGRVAGKNTVVVFADERQAEAKKIETERIIIATGTEERVIPGVAIDGRQVLTSKEALIDEELPDSIVIIGGGAVGVEFAYVYNALGCRVVLVEMEQQLLPGMDSEIARELERIFQKKGIAVLTRTVFHRLEKFPDRVEVRLQTPEGGKRQSARKLLLAVGREPLTRDLGLEEVGVDLERGFVKVDQTFRTSCETVYAIGDVIGPPLLAHAASEEGIVAVESMVGKRARGVDYGKIPMCIYCQPEVAAIGLTEEEAHAKGSEIKVGKFPFRASGKAIVAGHEEGWVKIIADKQYGEILGCHIIGKGATDLIGEIGLARHLEATTVEVGRTVHAHPTLSEAIMEAALQAEGASINI